MNEEVKISKLFNVRMKILLPVMILGLFSVVGLAMLISNVSTINSDVSSICNQEIPALKALDDMKSNVIQVQQWLTDVSATAFEDGYEEAETAYNNVIADADIIKGFYSDLTGDINVLLEDLDAYYETGIRMAHAYVEQGRDAGNEIMLEFDGTAEELAERVDIVSEYVEKKVEEIEKVTINQIDFSKSIAVALVIILAIILIVLVPFINAIIVKPLTKVTEFIKRISGQDLTITPVEVKGQDEIAVLSSSANNLLTTLQDIVTRLQNSAAELNESSATLNTHTNEITNALNETANTVTQIASTVNDQANSNKIASENVSDLSNSVTDAKNMAGALSDLNVDVQKTSKDGLAAVQKLYEVTEENQKSFKEILRVMDEIKVSTETIGAASDMVQSIAQQTNLLSLNASIEAARAGDAGKGFAVVADEIRKLADESEASVKQINEMLEALKRSVEDAVIAGDKMSETAKQEQAQLQETVDAYKNINSGLDEMGGHIDNIAKSSEQMYANCQNVMNIMDELSGMANDNASAAQECSASTEEVLASMTAVADLSERVSEEAKDQDSIVKTFNI